MFASVEKNLAKALLEASEGSDVSKAKASDGVNKLKDKLKNLSDNISEERELSKMLLKNHKIDEDSEDFKQASDLA